MTRIVVDATLRDQLAGASGEVEVCDASGRVLGRFLPSYGGSEEDLVSPHPSNEELHRLANSGEPTYTTAQVLEHLRNLERT